MNIIRSLISLLIVALIVISLFGIAWWQSPPEKLASYTRGGQVILGALATAGAFGLWRLWAPPKPSQRA